MPGRRDGGIARGRWAPLLISLDRDHCTEIRSGRRSGSRCELAL